MSGRSDDSKYADSVFVDQGASSSVRVVVLQPKRLGMWVFLSVVAWQLLGWVSNG